MTQDELWAAYAARNPSFEGEGNVTMSAAGLQKLFAQTWSIAHDSGYRRGLKEATEAAKREAKQAAPIAPDIFREMFGGRRR